MIHRNYPKKNICIISDKFASKQYKNFLIKNKKLQNQIKRKINFSKDVNNSFIADAHLILNSDHFFQFMSGGTNVFTFFSRIRYLRVCTTLTNEMPYLYPFKSKPFAPWHTLDKNILIETNKRDISLFYKKLNEVCLK